MNDLNLESHFSRPYIIRMITSRPRLAFCILLGVLVYLFMPTSVAQNWITRAILSWNIGAGVYFVLALRMMFWSGEHKMQTRARMQDEGKTLILFLVIFAVASTLAAIVAELAVVKEMHGFIRYSHIALAGLTIATSWLFTHLMFALHYAHDYYGCIHQEARGGLQFPGNEKPDYADFLYFSFIIGTSAQTADVSFSSKQMRRTGLVHCVLAFFFNTTLLALTINIASGLF